MKYFEFEYCDVLWDVECVFEFGVVRCGELEEELVF